MGFWIKKLLLLLVTVLSVISLTFLMMKAIPGDPFSEEKIFSSEVKLSLYRYYGLDAPLWVQYKTYLNSLLKGDLGYSLKYQGLSVNNVIKEGFPLSLCLGVEALFLAFSGGLLLGTLSALKKAKWQEYSAMVFVILAISIPSFILASFLQYLFAWKLQLLPVARWGTFKQTILPALALAAYPMAFLTRLIRVQMLEVLQQDYILTARAKQIPRRAILLNHALPNALLPLFPYLGPMIANILVGSFVVEQIFAIPGLGKWFVTSVANRDYPLILGTTLFYTLMVLLISFVLEIVHAIFDPRTRT